MTPQSRGGTVASMSDCPAPRRTDHPGRRVPLLGHDYAPLGGDSDGRYHHEYSPPNRGVDAQSLWLWEILSFAATAALYGVYFYLLFKYDNQLVARWEEDNISFAFRLFRTLPSAISLIATLMKGAMLFPVASAIGQLKWHYLRYPRRIKAVELIDGASRGYWGAARLLASKNGISSASLGGIIIIGTIFQGPFLQNTVQQTRILLEQPLVSGAEALLPVTNEVVARDQADPSSSGIGLAMLSSIQAAWATAAKSVDIQLTQLPYKCSHDYCEWVNVETLGVGSQCHQADVETRRHPTSGVLYGFSNQADLLNIGRATNSTSGITSESIYLTRLNLLARPAISQQSSFADRSNDLPLILHLGVLGYYNGTYHAAECVLYWAVHHYEFVFLNSSGEFWPEMVEHNRTSTPVVVNTTSPIRLADIKTCNFNGTTNPCNYSVQPNFHRGVQGLLLPFLTGISNSYPREIPEDYGVSHSIDFSNPKIEMFYGDWIDRIDYGDFEPDGSLARQAGRFMENMALYMTNNIRSNSNLFVVGATGSFGPYFAIKKHYAVYPAAFLAASILFVSVTAWRTRQDPIWKNSAVALLYHGFEKSTALGPG